MIKPIKLPPLPEPDWYLVMSTDGDNVNAELRVSDEAAVNAALDMGGMVEIHRLITIDKAEAYATAAIEAIIHPEVTEFELIQDGIPVAGSSGPREEAWREIQHYAAQYSEDGPVEFYEVIRRRVEGEGE
jgi:hypothetical protein